MSKLIMMVGIPGSGKSTYAKKMKAEYEVYVSRDDIRFSMVNEDEPYFSREKEVFTKFVKTISDALKNDLTVWADATHISTHARLKLLCGLDIEPDEIEIIYMNTPLERCLAQNELRKGTRSYVPEDVIFEMHENLTFPSHHEGKFIYNTVWIKTPETVIIPIYKEDDE